MMNVDSRISLVGNITLELFVVAECTLLYRTLQPLYTFPTGLHTDPSDNWIWDQCGNYLEHTGWHFPYG